MDSSVLEDRSDLDDQPFETFARRRGAPGQPPALATGRADLRGMLQVASGGAAFATMRKPLPEGGKTAIRGCRSAEAWWWQTRRTAASADLSAALRAALPRVSFIGFAGTPIAAADADAVAVLGDCMDVYDMQRSKARPADVLLRAAGAVGVEREGNAPHRLL